MLANAVQGIRRIYTIIRLKVRGSGDDDDAFVERRRYIYLKEYGEFRIPSAVEKRHLERASAPCRFDLVSQDGSVALELDVPRGAESLLDYYLVKNANVSIPLREVYQWYFASLRPMKPLDSLNTRDECVATVRSAQSMAHSSAAVELKLTYQIYRWCFVD